MNWMVKLCTANILTLLSTGFDRVLYVTVNITAKGCTHWLAILITIVDCQVYIHYLHAIITLKDSRKHNKDNCCNLAVNICSGVQVFRNNGLLKSNPRSLVIHKTIALENREASEASKYLLDFQIQHTSLFLLGQKFIIITG